jgi:hypothetical protein
MLDSGVSENHPHITRPLQGGITISPTAGEQPGYRDMLGHGTAVCALLQEIAPDADLYAVRIFDRQLATSISVVLSAMRWCLQHEIDIINLSLGTTNDDHRRSFRGAVQDALQAGVAVVSAYEVNGVRMLPGSLPGVVGAVEEADCERDEFRVRADTSSAFGACPFPRDIDGVPRERNLRGVSFSVAHLSAAIARRWPREGVADWPAVLAREAAAFTALPAQSDRDQQA